MRRSVGRQRRERPVAGEGITILEVLVAVLIASSAVALLAPTLSRQLSASSDTGGLTAVESVVSRDLDWISDYARWWKLSRGPYNLTAAITTTGTFTPTPEAEYAPPADRCAAGTLANAFLADLATVTTSPARPYAIDTSAGAVSTLTTVNGV